MPPKRGRPTRRNRVVEEEVGPPLPPQRNINVADVANIVAQAINAAMTAVIQQLPRASGVQAPTGLSPWERVMESFLKGNPPEFEGGTDAVKANQWKKDMQRHLRMIECSEDKKQVLTTFKLVGSALHWWETMTTPEQRDTMTITEFWALFDLKYFPPAVQIEMKRKLQDVVQGERSVAEYEEEFTRLASFVPDEVTPEERKISKFMGGLNWRIRQHLLGNPALQTFGEVMNAALLHCQEHRLYRQVSKKATGMRQVGKPGGFIASNNNTRHGQGAWQQAGRGGPGNRGHPGRGTSQFRNSRGRGQEDMKGRCFQCGEAGHYKNECPQMIGGQFPRALQQPHVQFPPPVPIMVVPPQQGQLQYGHVCHIQEALLPPALPAPPVVEGKFLLRVT